MDYKTLATDMAEYRENKKRLVKAKGELDVILYDLCGVRGVSYDSIMVHGNPTQKALNWLTTDEKFNDKENEIKRYESAIANVETMEKKIPKELWAMLYEKFIQGKTYEYMGIKYGYSNNGMWHWLKRETEKFL